eukprot:10415-Heterococcus_DN1.PRE.2
MFAQTAEWFGADCSLRHCPGGNDPETSNLDETVASSYPANKCPGSPLNTASGAATSRCHIDCSGRGKCNYSTGKCTCFPGYADAACSTFRDDGYNVDSL